MDFDDAPFGLDQTLFMYIQNNFHQLDHPTATLDENENTTNLRSPTHELQYDDELDPSTQSTIIHYDHAYNMIDCFIDHLAYFMFFCKYPIDHIIHRMLIFKYLRQTNLSESYYDDHFLTPMDQDDEFTPSIMMQSIPTIVQPSTIPLPIQVGMKATLPNPDDSRYRLPYHLEQAILHYGFRRTNVFPNFFVHPQHDGETVQYTDSGLMLYRALTIQHFNNFTTYLTRRFILEVEQPVPPGDSLVDNLFLRNHPRINMMQYRKHLQKPSIQPFNINPCCHNHKMHHILLRQLF